MGYNHAQMSFTAKRILKMTETGKIEYENILQRGKVWNRSQKSMLILSMIEDVPIPAVFCKKVADDSGKSKDAIYDILDGKQRLSTIVDFLNDGFSLTEMPEITYVEEEKKEKKKEQDEEKPDEVNKEVTVNVNRKRFSKLPSELQEKILDTSISFIYFDDLQGEEERNLFQRYNNGLRLSTKSRALASCNDIEGLLAVGKHPVFDGMLSPKARDNKFEAIVVMKAWMMLNKKIDELSFEAKNFNPELEKAKVTNKQKSQLKKVFDTALAIYNAILEKDVPLVAKKMYRETHFISLIPFFDIATTDNYDIGDMADWIISFFDAEDETSVSNDYNNASGAGNAKTTSIKARQNALLASFNEFFKR